MQSLQISQGQLSNEESERNLNGLIRFDILNKDINKKKNKNFIIISPSHQQLSESDQINCNLNISKDEENEEEDEEKNEKLEQIVKRMKKIKKEKRAKDLVSSLPSRMLKSFDKNKFDLLNDLSFFYDESNYIQLILNAERKNQDNDSTLLNSKFQKQQVINQHNIQSNNQTNSNYVSAPIENVTINNNTLLNSNCNQVKSPINKIERNSFQEDQLKLQMSQSIISLKTPTNNNNQNLNNQIEANGQKIPFTITSIGSQYLQSNILHKDSKKKLSPQHFRNFFSFETAKWLKVVLKKAEIILDNIPILHPSSPTKYTWDFLNIGAILVSMYFIPITIIFNFAFSAIIPKYMIILIPHILIIDVLVNLNTGYFEKGQVIKSRLAITKMYAKKNLLTDILSVMPFIFCLYDDTVFHSGQEDKESVNYKDSYASNSAVNILKMLFFLKIRAFSQILKRIEERFTLSHVLKNVLSLIKLLLTIIMINHLFACLWVFVAHLEQDANFTNTWMIGANVNESVWSQQYLAAYYFMTVTMITVGYGDILPKNSIEMILCIITMMLACCVFGYSLNEIGAIFSSFFKVENEIKNKISTIQRFLSKKGINQKLQYQIREYLEYYWRESSQMNSEQEQIIIQQLSESLKSKLLFEANKIVLKDSPIFKGNFSKYIIEQTVPLINELKYSPESLICSRNVEDDQSIFFIENGSVDVVLDAKVKNTRTLFTLKKGDFFGAFSFFTGLPRTSNVRSKEFTTVLKIKRNDFIQLVQSSSEDHETFCAIKDSIIYLNDYTKVELKCKACSSSRHSLEECQYLHYIPNKQRVINLYNEKIKNENLKREPYRRRFSYGVSNPYQNSRAIHEVVLEQVEEFWENNQDLILSKEDMYSDSYYENDSDGQIHQDREYVEQDTSASIGSSIFAKKKLNDFKQEKTNTKAIEIIEEADEGDATHESITQKKEDYQKNQIPTIEQFINKHTENKSDIDDLDALNLSSSNNNASYHHSNRSIAFSDHLKTLGLSKSGKKIPKTNSQESNISKKISFGRDNSNNFSLPRYSLLSTQGDEQFELLKKSSSLAAKKNSLKRATRRVLNVCRIFEGQKTVEQKLLMPQIEENIAIKQRYFESKNTLGKFNSKIIQSKTSNNYKSDHLNLETVFQQLQQLIALSQQNKSNDLIDREDSFMMNNYEVDQTNIFQNFDKMKNFVKYNPRFNYGSIISRLNQILDIYKKNDQAQKQPNSNQTDKITKQKGGIARRGSIKTLEVPVQDLKKMSKFSHGVGIRHLSLPNQIDSMPLLNQSCFEKSVNCEVLTLIKKDFLSLKDDKEKGSSVSGFNESENNLIKEKVEGQNFLIQNSSSTTREINRTHNDILVVGEDKLSMFQKDEKKNSNDIFSQFEAINEEECLSPNSFMHPHQFDFQSSNIGTRSINDQ